MKYALGLLFLISNTALAIELSGTPQELEGFIHPPKRSIVISEEVSRETYSDQAIMHLLVTTESKKLSVSMSDNETLQGKIVQALVEAGIARDSINTDKFSQSPGYGWFGDKPSSYSVANKMTITVTDAKGMASVASLVDEYDEITMGDMTFKHSEKDKVEKELQQEVLDKVLSEKAFYENALGLKLKAVNFQKSKRSPIVYNNRQNRRAKMMSSDMVAMEEVMVTTAKQFDKLEYKAYLTVEFEVQ